VQEDEQVIRSALCRWPEAKNAAGRHSPRLLSRDDSSVN
jgi:hypothetical protein